MHAPNKTRDRIRSLSAGTLLISTSASAGIGFLGFDSQGFLRNSSGRGNANFVLTAGPDMAYEGKLFSAKLLGQAKVFAQDIGSFTFEAQDAYVSTSKKLSDKHQLTLGRRIYDWSIADDRWKLGTWSPRFMWDPVRPTTVGNIGAFYTFESKGWRVIAEGSPVTLPERGFPIRGDMTSASGDWINPPTELDTGSAILPINYTVLYPDMSTLLLKPTGALSVKYRHDSGAWVSANFAYKPVHQVILSADPGINPLSNSVEVYVNPYTVNHLIVTAEAGFQREEWSLWASGSRDAPELRALPSTWSSAALGPSTVGAFGADYQAHRSVLLSGSYLFVDEQSAITAAPGAMSLPLPGRYQYGQALRMSGQYVANDFVVYDVAWIHDISNLSHFVSLDFTYTSPSRAWRLGVGGDTFISSTQTGTLGQFLGNDRLRAKISFAF